MTNLSSALIGMLMSSSKFFLFSKEAHLNSGMRLLLELYCVVVIKHVAFFTIWVKLTMPFTCTSLPLTFYLWLLHLGFWMWFWFRIWTRILVDRQIWRKKGVDRRTWIPLFTPLFEPWPGALCCVVGQDTTLTVSLPTQMYKCVLANLMLRVTLLWTSIPSRGE